MYLKRWSTTAISLSWRAQIDYEPVHTTRSDAYEWERAQWAHRRHIPVYHPCVFGVRCGYDNKSPWERQRLCLSQGAFRRWGKTTALTCRLFCRIALECGQWNRQRLPFQCSMFRIGTGCGRAEARPYHKKPTLERKTTVRPAAGRWSRSPQPPGPGLYPAARPAGCPPAQSAHLAWSCWARHRRPSTRPAALPVPAQHLS